MPLAGAALAAPVRVSLGAFAFFLVLHPPVLEPDLHLLLGQVQVRGYLDPPQPGQVHVGGEFPLQLQELGAGKSSPHPLPILNLAGFGPSWTGEKCELQRDREKRGGRGARETQTDRRTEKERRHCPAALRPRAAALPWGHPLSRCPPFPAAQGSYPCRGSGTSGGR